MRDQPHCSHMSPQLHKNSVTGTVGLWVFSLQYRLPCDGLRRRSARGSAGDNAQERREAVEYVSFLTLDFGKRNALGRCHCAFSRWADFQAMPVAPCPTVGQIRTYSALVSCLLLSSEESQNAKLHLFIGSTLLAHIFSRQ